MRLPPIAAVTIALIFHSIPLSAREPTELEQYCLELINQARANPAGEVRRLSTFPWDGTPDLNEGLPAGTISNLPKPPLAFNALLVDAASGYADLLLANQAFDHYFGGTTPEGRMTAAGYSFTAPSASSENLAWTTKFPSNPLNATAVEEHHRNLFIDRRIAGRGHRTTLMQASLQEAGIAIRPDTNRISSAGRGLIDILSVQDFAFSQGRVFVTGIIFADLDQDKFFTPDTGEAVGRATVEVLNSTGKVVASGKSFASGGYAINLAGQASGNYVLKITELSGKTSSAEFAFNGSTNVKVDITGNDSNILVKKKLKKRIKNLSKKLKKAKSKTEKQKYRKQITKLRKKLKSL